MKKWDWSLCGHCPERTKWLKENHDKQISEEEFVEAWKKTRIFSRKKHAGRRNSPSAYRNEYKNLKNEFGFFS
jgi:hypothetical protein